MSSVLCMFAKYKVKYFNHRTVIMPIMFQVLENIPLVYNKMAKRNCNNIVWFDGEMTGLDVNKQTLLEAAAIITDGHLNIISESPNIIIHQSDEVLENMEDWPKKHHAQSGLTESCRNSTITLEQADQMLYDFIKPLTIKGKCALAGNSIYMDRMFIRKYLPKLESHLSYRLIDVSTVKELLKRWDPEAIRSSPQKMMKHRALDDIKESINELIYYKKYFKL